MNKVFIVTAGCYSDYGICSCFSTKELAKAYVATYNASEQYDSDKAQVEEWDLDGFGNDLRPGTSFYLVRIKKDGEVMEVYPSSSRFEGRNRRTWDIHGNLCLTSVVATDPAHAVKIASEIRAGIVAENAWGKR